MKHRICIAVAICMASPAAWAGVLLPNARPDEPLRVRKERVTVTVADQVLQVVVGQVFENDGDKPVEATFVQRVPEGAAVSGFAHWVDGQRVESRVKEKAQAKADYQAARKAGQAAALLSQLKRGAFAMRVARLEPGQTRRVELRYSGLLGYRDGTIDLELPLRLPQVRDVERGELSIVVDIVDRKEIVAVRSTTLPIKTERISANHWRVRYRVAQAKPTQDLKLQYDVRSKDIGLTFLTHRAAGQDGYFMLLAAPQELTSHRDIVKKDVVFVFDVSGSMHGEKIVQARGALKRCLSFMNRDDRFGIIAFSDGLNPYQSWLQPVAGSAVQKAEAFVDKLEAAGGTDIQLALSEGLKLLGSSDRPKVIVFLTDGQATSGITGSEAILQAIKGKNSEGARIFTFGVGGDVNRSLLERLGRENRGGVDLITAGADLERAVASFYAKISRPVLADLQLDFGEVTTAMTYPNVLPDLYKGTQLLLLGRYRGDGEVRARLSGDLNGAPKHFPFRASFPQVSGDHAFLPALWARRRIAHIEAQMRMHGETDEGRREIVELGKRHHVATRYTSLVATSSPRLAALSPARVKPGDPEIRIRAPRDARAVTVVFPFGVTKAARYEPDQDLWTVRFLIPRDTPDGSYSVRILVTAADGRQQTFTVSYTVDTAAPKVVLSLTDPLRPGTTVGLEARQVITERDLAQAPGYDPRRAERTRRLFARMMADARTVTVRLPSGRLLRLRAEGAGRWRGRWQVPSDLASQLAGRPLQLEVIAVDVAGNRSQQVQSLSLSTVPR